MHGVENAMRADMGFFGIPADLQQPPPIARSHGRHGAIAQVMLGHAAWTAAQS
jgi:hypothetical protein